MKNLIFSFQLTQYNFEVIKFPKIKNFKNYSQEPMQIKD
jgi:hypothetical protein